MYQLFNKLYKHENEHEVLKCASPLDGDIYCCAHKSQGRKEKSAAKISNVKQRKDVEIELSVFLRNNIFFWKNSFDWTVFFFIILFVWFMLFQYIVALVGEWLVK